MINRKVASFTVIEVTIAMLIAAIAISITYTAYNIVGKLYLDYTTTQKKYSQVTLLNELLNLDCISAERIIRTREGFQVNSRKGEIQYIITDDFIIRDQFSLRRDTFMLSVSSKIYYFEGQQTENEEAIDQISLSVGSLGYIIPLKYYKQYSSQNLFE